MRADIINEWLTRQALPALTGEQAALLEAYQAHLLAVNEHMNLTAITQDADFAVKHFIDSLTVLPWIAPNARVLDLGTGAGFPGIPLKIMRPDIKLTLLDSLRKRVLFLQETVNLLGLQNVDCIHARAEELARQAEHRAGYAVCTARAVAKLEVLAGYALPFLQPGGRLLAMKGPGVAAEAEAAGKTIAKLGGGLLEIRRVELSPEIVHTVVVVEKL